MNAGLITVGGGSVTTDLGTLYVDNTPSGQRLYYTPFTDTEGTDEIDIVITNGTDFSASVVMTVNILAQAITYDTDRKVRSHARGASGTASVYLNNEFNLAAGDEELTYTITLNPGGYEVDEFGELTYPYSANGPFRQKTCKILVSYSGATADVELTLYVIEAGPAPNVRGIKRILGRMV